MIVEITQPDYGGTFQAIPKAAPRYVLPGERVDLDPFTILTSSPNRTQPLCPHFGACGGCDYQHATYPIQIELKQQILHQTLASQGLSLPQIETHRSPPWEYRNRIRLRVETIAGQPAIGYNRRATHDFLPIEACPISAPILLRAAHALLTLTQQNRWLPSIAEVEFLTAKDESTVQMTLLTRDARTQGFAELCTSLAAILPELTGAGTLPATAGAKERAHWGQPGLTQQVGENTYWVTRGAFFQINRTLSAKMLQIATENRAGTLAWDLYAGVGLFARVLAQTFAKVIAVESAEPAATDLARTPKTIKNLQAIRQSTEEFLRRALLQRDRPDLIVMDPPRAGLGPETARLLARIGAPRLTYVSCDPTTLARDLRMLVDSGYRITETHLLDMFPQTFHIESIVLLEQ
jgi:23S rRNA (uracil1939-C5)-methyltransferase